MFRKFKGWYLIVIAAVFFFLSPAYVTKENINYYGSMLCTLTGKHYDIKDDALQTMLKNITVGTNADYALQRHSYNRQAGERVLSIWHSLSPEQQAKAREDQSYCVSLMQRGQGFGW